VAYIDFKRLNRIHDEKAFFVVRAKENFQGTIVKSYGSDVHQGVLKDTLQKLNVYQSRRNYPSNVRVVEFFDIEQHKTFTFLTNNLKIKATTVAQLYKYRWYVELFFKWIKQNLKIKSFWGQIENAVRIQIWVAISVNVLVAIVRKKLSIEHSLYESL